MASTCPKCHNVLEDDDVCCADLKYTWKCKSCGKLSTGFVVPYGRCYLCGGENDVIEGYSVDDPRKIRVIEEAVQYELDMYSFYRMAKERTSNEKLKSLLEEMFLKEKDHIAELEEKYHVHLDAAVLAPADVATKQLSSWIFQGIDFEDTEGHVAAVFDKAIEMERRTRDYFKARADALPAGVEQELYRELAAEEEDHVAMLETERDLYVDDEN